jgi:hypothetical protein
MLGAILAAALVAYLPVPSMDRTKVPVYLDVVCYVSANLAWIYDKLPEQDVVPLPSGGTRIFRFNSETKQRENIDFRQVPCVILPSGSDGGIIQLTN